MYWVYLKNESNTIPQRSFNTLDEACKYCKKQVELQLLSRNSAGWRYVIDYHGTVCEEFSVRKAESWNLA